MPIMQSPSYHKYDVQDYMTVDKDYGTNDDMKKLVEEAHKRHINVIIDFVINHSSRQHEWFQKAKEELKEGKTDGYADYYHFEKNAKRQAGILQVSMTGTMRANSAPICPTSISKMNLFKRNTGLRK